MRSNRAQAAALLAAAFLGTALAETAPVVRTVFPTEIAAPLNNPYMGWGLWAGPRYFNGKSFSLEYNTTGFGDDAPLFGWVLIDWMWSDLEPKEGVYDWRELDAILNYWAARGKRSYLRVWVTDDPGWDGAPGNEVCPEWLWAAGARFRSYTGEGKSAKREPDYLDPSFEKVYLPKVRKFLTALAQRYDKPDSPVFMWGVMGYGQWGEWHSMWSKYPWPNAEAKHEVLAKIVDMYAGIFQEQQPMISYCFDTDLPQVKSLRDFLYRQALDKAMEHGFALARHGFIDGLRLWDKLVMETFWRRAPMLAEGDWSYSDVKDHGTHGTLDEHMQVFTEWHSNYAHFYMDAASYRRAMREEREYFARGLESGGLGYRLVLTSASWPEEVPAGNLLMIRQTWVNRNAGRCYKRFPLKIYLTDQNGGERFSRVDGAFDETSWAQGETYPVTTLMTIARKLPPGIYDLRVALVDDSGAPALGLGIAGDDGGKRYRLGTIRILPPVRP